MDMINAILSFPKIKEKDDVNRIQAIRNVIENITIEKDQNLIVSENYELLNAL